MTRDESIENLGILNRKCEEQEQGKSNIKSKRKILRAKRWRSE
jgi:hypothetical protein